MFSTFEIVKDLCEKQGISLNTLEEKLELGKNSLYGLKRNQPSAERLQQIADYFHVSTDYLLGRTDNPAIASDSDETFSVKGRAIARKYDSSSPEKQKYYDKIIAAMFEDDEEDD
ncbi:helix-turn-helix domain-containing protein [Streptococcus constellatus]|uniref:helix-turn-helix domain-containing protein n=1 Tax=Streptococcus constellatus TaxID=76860 RepID=UPI000660BAAF|nr:helix-turn-helix transcriptional regulator [Streptococcus constellatus]